MIEKSRPLALFVSYFFPPLGGPGVYRPLKFCKYLPAWGWDTVVVSAQALQLSIHDDSLIKEIPPQTCVYRLKSEIPWHTIACEWLGHQRLGWRFRGVISGGLGSGGKIGQ